MKKLLALSLAASLALTPAATSFTVYAANQGTASEFSDLQHVPAALKDAIKLAVDKGLLTGNANGEFRPSATLTRQELAVIIQRALKLPLNGPAHAFKDVPAAEWASPAIEAVRKAGIMTGDGKGSFRPKDRVTREELAVLLLRASGVPINAKAVQSVSVSDQASVKSWAWPYVQTALALGIIKAEGSAYVPAGSVNRQEAAAILLETFYPEDRPSTLGAIEGSQIKVNGISYTISEHVKDVLSVKNAAILKGASIEFEHTGFTIDRITSLTLTAKGKPAEKDNPEFSGNLVLDGNGATIDGDLTVAGDYASVLNVQVTGNFLVSSELENDFYASHLTVHGQTDVQGGDSNTVVFESSSLDTVNVSKQDVRVEATGTTTVSDLNVTANASIVSGDSAAVGQVTLADGASSVNLQGNIGTVVMTSSSPTTLSGNANIATLSVQTNAPVTLSSTGTVSSLQVTNPESTVNVSGNTTVTNVSLGTGVPATAVSGTTASSSTTTTSTVNTAPYVVTAIPDQLIQLGATDATYDLTPHFKDKEQTKLNYAANSGTASVLKVSVNADGLITYTPVKGGKAKVTIAVDDFLGKRVTAFYYVTVNTAPVNAGLTDQSLMLGSDDMVLKLSELITDPDQDGLTYEATVQDPTIAAATLGGTSSNELSIKALKVGTTSITLTATDGRGGSYTTSFNFTVLPIPNRKPVSSTQPNDLSVYLGDTDTSLDLAAIFSDPDGDTLTYTAEAADPTIALPTLDGSKLSVLAKALGTTVITVTATDGDGLSESAAFNITVNPVPNFKPVIDSAPADKSMIIGDSDNNLDLADVFSDPENETMTFTSASADPAIAAASVNGSKVSLLAKAVGTTTVTVTATDNVSQSESATFNVTVSPIPNRKPVVSNPPSEHAIVLGNSDNSLDLATVFSDPDGDALTYTVETADPSIVDSQLDGSKVTLTSVAPGTTTVTVTAKDGDGLTASATFTVKVKGNNEAPTVVASIYEQVLTPGVTNDRNYDLSQLFEDADGDTLTFTAVSSSAAFAQASVSGSTLTLSPGTGAGTATVSITADDGKGGTAAYDLAVRTAPLAANGNLSIRTRQGVKDPVTVDLSTYFPNQTSFKVYSGTADSTFTGPTPLNSTTWVWDGMAGLQTWIIGADGTAVVVNVAVDPQGPVGAYFSEYLDAGDGRMAVELYFNGNGDPNFKAEGYTVEYYRYMKATNQINVQSVSIFPFWPNMTYNMINNIFYDFFDLINVAYYNDDSMFMYSPNDFNLVGLVLKKDGQVVDVLGDPTSHDQFLPNGGTIVRKSGIYSGSSKFSLYGEYNIYPKGSLQFYGRHTP